MKHGKIKPKKEMFDFRDEYSERRKHGFSFKLVEYFIKNREKKLKRKCFAAFKPTRKHNLHKRVKTLEKVVFTDTVQFNTPQKYTKPTFINTPHHRRRSWNNPAYMSPANLSSTRQATLKRIQGLELIDSVHKKVDILETRLMTKRSFLY